MTLLLLLYLGLHQSEKVLNDVNIKNHRCFRDFRMTSSLRVSKNAHIIIRSNKIKSEIMLLLKLLIILRFQNRS